MWIKFPKPVVNLVNWQISAQRKVIWKGAFSIYWQILKFSEHDKFFYSIPFAEICFLFGNMLNILNKSSFLVSGHPYL